MRNLVILLGLVLVALGCQQPSSGSSGPGTVHISLGSSTRTVAADWVSTIDRYDVVLHCSSQSRPDRDAVVQAASVADGVSFASVEPGTWTVGVTALNAAGKILGVGTLANQEIGRGSSRSFTVPVVRTQTATGDFQFAFSFPQEAADQVKAQLSTATGSAVGAAETPALTSATVNGHNAYAAVVSRSTLSSGAYRLTLTFTKGAAVVGVYVEAVNVWDNVVSNRWLDGTGTLVSSRDFSASEFASTNASLAGLAATDGGQALGLSPDFSSSVATYYLATAAAQVSVTLTAGQSAAYQLTTLGSSTPTTWPYASWPAAASHGQTLWIRVTAPDQATTKVYRVNLTGDLAWDLAWTTPAANEVATTGPTRVYLGNTYEFAAQYEANGSAATFHWYLDGTEAASGVASTATGSTWTWTPAPSVGIGVHGIAVTATDAATGLTYSHSQSVKVAPIIVEYGANEATSGAVPASAAYYLGGATVTVLGNTGGLGAAGVFLGWNTAADGSGTPYTAGQSFPATEPTTLYAQFSSGAYAVLDTGPGGGLIFYDKGFYSNGWRYLECAPADAAKSGVPWATAAITPAYTNGGLGKGYGDVYTARIVALNPGPNAASLCRAYTGKGYTDWYLPTVDELALIDSVLYQNYSEAKGDYLPLGGLNEGLVQPGYWASDYKINSNNALLSGCWYRNFSTHAAWNDWAQTTTSFGVRAVRAF